MSDGERQYIEDKLLTVYTSEGVEIWMNARHKLLEGAVPVDLIQAGEADRVLAVATQLAESAYA